MGVEMGDSIRMQACTSRRERSIERGCFRNTIRL